MKASWSWQVCYTLRELEVGRATAPFMWKLVISSRRLCVLCPALCSLAGPVHLSGGKQAAAEGCPKISHGSLCLLHGPFKQ
jgi:hypothetical protein